MNKKILALLAITVCFFSLISCNGEEEVDYKPKNYLAGVWAVTQVGALNSQNILNYENVSTECDFDTYAFNEDLTFSYTDYSFADTCTSTVISGTYELVNGYIVLSYVIDGAEKTQSLDLLTLTGAELSLVYTNQNSELVFLKMTNILILS